MKLKPDSLNRVRVWAAELNRRKDEVLATLRDEQVVVDADPVGAGGIAQVGDQLVGGADAVCVA